MKKILFFAVMLLAFSSTDCYGQKWLNKLNNALDATNKVLESTNEALESLSGTSSSSSSSSSSSVGSKPVPVSSERVESTGGAFKISTGYPDLKVKVKRCVASERTLVIDLTFENVGPDDVYEFKLYGFMQGATAIDDDANDYSRNVYVALSNGEFNHWYSNTSNLFSEAPIKGRIKLEGLSPRATMIRVLQIPYQANGWGTKTITIKNLPISRDDDE